MKARFSADGNEVTMTRINPWTDDVETVIYFVPQNGGYVRIRDAEGRNPQVCSGLARTGNALEATPDNLIDVIRRNHRKSVTDARNDSARY